MKAHRVSIVGYLSLFVLVIGFQNCGFKEFAGKTVSGSIASPDGNPDCAANKVSTQSWEEKAPTLFETKGKKIQINENAGGDASAFSSQKTLDPILVAGKELVVVVNEKCVHTERIQQTENSEQGLSAEIALSALAPSDEKSYVLTLEQDLPLSELENRAESDPCVIGVNENLIHKAFAIPSDTLYSQQEHLVNIRASQGWDVFFHSTTGINQDLVIAVIDTGVDQNHNDIRNIRWINTGEVAGNGMDDDGNGYVDDVNGYNFASDIANPQPQVWPSPDAGGETHGTHVAGMVAAQSNNSLGIAGVNGMRAKIMSLNVFGPTSGAETVDIDNAIRYAADKGAHIINLSLGGAGESASTDAAIKYAISKGAVVTIAAGNSNADAGGFSPARYGQSNNGAMAVGATHVLNNSKCPFSNYNPSYVEMAAPGCRTTNDGLLSTMNGGGYGRMQGTSISTPLLAGAASLAYGLIWARSGVKPTPSFLEEIMKAGARTESGLSSSFLNGKVIDLVALSKEINKRYPTGQTPSADCP